MRIKIFVYKVTDFFGNVSWDCSSDSCNTIIVWGYDKNNKYHQFESEGYHIHTWASEHEFKVEVLERWVEI